MKFKNKVLLALFEGCNAHSFILLWKMELDQYFGGFGTNKAFHLEVVVQNSPWKSSALFLVLNNSTIRLTNFFFFFGLFFSLLLNTI